MNQEQKSKVEAQTKLAIDNVHADIKSEFSSCTTLTELQDIYKGAMDATCVEAIKARLCTKAASIIQMTEKVFCDKTEGESHEH